MRAADEHGRLVNRIPLVLDELLGIPQADATQALNRSSGPDLVVHAGGRVFLVEFKKSTSASSIAMAAQQVQEYRRSFGEEAIPIVAVPLMGAVGRKTCEEAGVGWLDLSGNARIVAPGIRIIVTGRPSLFPSSGRPPNLFAPRSSRVVRWALMHADRYFSQREIARSTGLDEGFVSRLVARLVEQAYLVRDERGAVRPRDPALLLEAWRETYQFSRHSIRRGHVSARTGDQLLQLTSDVLREGGVEHAATGLAAAWMYNQFAGFRLATLYVPADPPLELLQRIGWREDPRGANLWLVAPNDAGVLQGVESVDGIPCVSPLQVYLDLKDQPERSVEAAERLRTDLLMWRQNG